MKNKCNQNYYVSGSWSGYFKNSLPVILTLGLFRSAYSIFKLVFKVCIHEK